VYAAIVWPLITFAYIKWGLWSFNAYTYYAGALALVWMGHPGAFNNQLVGYVTPLTDYTGAGALFILVDVLGWFLAWCVSTLLYWLHNNEPRHPLHPEDDSSYGGGDEYETAQPPRRKTAPRKINRRINSSSVNTAVRARAANQTATTPQEEPLLAAVASELKFMPSAWTGAK
jgi:hypothetical protein